MIDESMRREPGTFTRIAAMVESSESRGNDHLYTAGPP